ncbi:PREDICTED: integrator complex subunit 1-like, partial [Bison bison bison]|uniref:Integrator complex subunit 1-like n=1 Tax=Bison bison bison TaxID=43346 RepID=A0A6P3HUE2_BISBB
GVPPAVPPTMLLDEIEAAELEGNDDRLEGVLCGAVKQLKVTRAKPDSVLYLSLMYLAKMKPNIFATEGVIEALCSLLRRDASVSFKAKGNSLVSVLACNLLMAAYEEDENWPEIFVKVYIEDSLGERIWVDSPHCRTFVDNIQTAFNTKMPPKSSGAPPLCDVSGCLCRPGFLHAPGCHAGDVTGSSSPDLEVLRSFQNQIAAIQRDAVWWLHTVVPSISKLAPKDYVHWCVHKVLFTEQPETYYKWDNWPPESDRNFFLRLCSEVPILEDTLMRILVIGLSRELPLGPADAMELADHLVKRAAAVQADEGRSHGPAGGCAAGCRWEAGRPPPSTLSWGRFTCRFDTHVLPGALRGPPRRPPPHILDQVKGLNQSLRLGHLLCRSRNPDFLLNIIQRQASSQSMPWLADLVQSSEGSLDVLPVQCLCEFLLHDAADEPASGGEEEEGESKEQKARKRQRQQKQKQLLGRLQDLLLGPKADEQTTCEVLDYFLRRLGSSQVAARVLAMKVRGPGPLLPWRWRQIPGQPAHCPGSSEYATISAYLVYLSQHTPVEEQGQHSDLALDVARLIVERSTIMSHLFSKRSCSAESDVVLAALLSIFSRYVQRMRKSKEGEEVYSWSESQDQVFLRWSSGETATMHILVVHAMVILLTLGPPRAGDSEFQALLDIWFPEKKPLPTAFLVDTSEEALLLPDWLKLRMIRSEVPRLVDAGTARGGWTAQGGGRWYCQGWGTARGGRWHCLGGSGPRLSLLARVRQGSPEVPGVAVRLLQALATLLSSPHGGALALAMHRSHVLACPLMRQLCQYQRCAPQDTGFSSLFLKVLVQALQWLDGPSVEAGPLQAQLRLFAAQCSAQRRISNVRSGFLHLVEALTFRGDPEAVSSTVRAIVATLKSGEQCDVEPELISKVLQSLIEARSPHLEELLAALFSTASAVPPSGPVAVVSSLLLPEKEEPLAPGKQEADSCSQEAMLLGPCSGLLVDWLEMLDPEVVGSCPDLQQRLLFSRGKGKGHPGPQVPSFRPYLLALLTHQSSWSTLHQCIRILLGRGREQR